MTRVCRGETQGSPWETTLPATAIDAWRWSVATRTLECHHPRGQRDGVDDQSVDALSVTVRARGATSEGVRVDA